ncbi:MAG: putative lipid II flippase FtsW [Bacillota bacterium]
MRWKKGSPDYVLILTILLLLSVGIVMVFSASAYSAMLEKGDRFHYLKRQVLWTLVGLPVMAFVMNVDYFRVKRFAGLFLVFSLVLLLLVPFMGIAKYGATRSLGFGAVTFQPSELVKPIVVMFMAKSLSDNQAYLHQLFKGLAPQLAVLAIVAGLIMAQPDLGTTVAVAGTSFVMFIAAGVRLAHLLPLGLVGLGGAALLVVSEEYRMRRILAFLAPEKDPTGAGFQIIQSLIALGSGGVFGMGLGEGRQKLLYIPERHTDFIFAIIGEELGFIGITVVIILFAILVWRGFRIAINAPDVYGSLLAVGLTTMVALQAVINMGVVSGSLPITGITLPLISYGGSSLLFTLVGLGMLLNISCYGAQR